jgi:hypothetical protein
MFISSRTKHKSKGSSMLLLVWNIGNTKFLFMLKILERSSSGKMSLKLVKVKKHPSSIRLSLLMSSDVELSQSSGH